jgi:hypothetical protein
MIYGVKTAAKETVLWHSRSAFIVLFQQVTCLTSHFPFSSVSSVHFISLHQLISCVSQPFIFMWFLFYTFYFSRFILFSVSCFIWSFLSPFIFFFYLCCAFCLFSFYRRRCLFKTVLSRARLIQYCCFIPLWRFRIQISFPKTRCPANYLPGNSSCNLLVQLTDFFPQSFTSAST